MLQSDSVFLAVQTLLPLLQKLLPEEQVSDGGGGCSLVRLRKPPSRSPRFTDTPSPLRASTQLKIFYTPLALGFISKAPRKLTVSPVLEQQYVLPVLHSESSFFAVQTLLPLLQKLLPLEHVELGPPGGGPSLRLETAGASKVFCRAENGLAALVEKYMMMETGGDI